MRYWYEDKHIDQWNRIGSPEINPYIYGQLIGNKGTSTIMGRIFFSTNGVGTTGIHIQKNEGGPFFHIIKITSQWIIGLNIKASITNFLEGDGKLLVTFC